MGQFATGWEKDVVTQLRTFCDAYSRSGKGDFDKRFRIVPVDYSQLFLDILREWAKEKKNQSDVETQVGSELVAKLMSWIADDGTVEKSFFWSHVFDVITYRLLPTVRDAVQVRVALQLYEGSKDLDEDENWSVIAHSLGTAVTHDTLQTWYTQPLDDIEVGFEVPKTPRLGDHRAPFLVQMIANVSRVLQNQYDVFASDVRPGKGCDYYYTVYHPLDPFTILRPFLPTAWPGPPSPDDYYHPKLEFDYIQQANIHDLAHYLRHPLVCIPLFRRLTFSSYITKDSEAAYVKQFKLHGDLKDPDLISVRQQLEDAGVSLPDSWTSILEVVNRLKDLVDFAEGGVNAT
jgi:hypothetical protein